MTDRALINGVIFGTPETRLSKAGKPFLLASIRSGNSEAVRWWRAFVFRESVIEEMKRLGDGDPIAISGEFDFRSYSPDGAEPRLSWTIRADAVLSARPRPRQKPPRAAPAKPESPPSDQGGRHFDDAIPF